MKTLKKSITVLLLITILLSLFGCFGPTKKEINYLLDKSNYDTLNVTCTLVEIAPTKDQRRYYIITGDYVSCDTKTPGIRHVCFKIDNASSKILDEHGFKEKMIPGTEFVCIFSPNVWYDGDIYPIVYVEIDGEVLLDFDTGYKNLMATYGVEIS